MAASRETFQFACPCCGKRIEINTRNGKSRALNFEDRKGGSSLDGLLDQRNAEQDRLDGLFREAQSDSESEAKRLEDKFHAAKEEAKKEGDVKPRNPFDLD